MTETNHLIPSSQQPIDHQGGLRHMTPSFSALDFSDIGNRDSVVCRDEVEVSWIRSNRDNIGIGKLRHVVLRASLYAIIFASCAVTITLRAASFCRHVTSIIAACTKEKVCRFATRSIVATVEYANTFWNWSVRYSPHNSMYSFLDTFDLHRPVAVLVKVTSPNPASVSARNTLASYSCINRSEFHDTSVKVGDYSPVRLVTASRRLQPHFPAMKSLA